MIRGGDLLFNLPPVAQPPPRRAFLQPRGEFARSAGMAALLPGSRSAVGAPDGLERSLGLLPASNTTWQRLKL